jgi:gamma-glutamyl:cysteine ligase YbdK (ATP-grasp superfamily)
VLDGDVPRRLADAARETVARLRPVARELGDEDELDGVRMLVEDGGAERRRAAFVAGGMSGVLRGLVDETAASAERFPPGAARVDRHEASSNVR